MTPGERKWFTNFFNSICRAFFDLVSLRALTGSFVCYNQTGSTTYDL